MKLNFLAVKITLVVALGMGTTWTGISVHAAMAVIDASNLKQNIMTAMESVSQTLKQIEQYQTQLLQYHTQLQQYENMVKNTMAPVAYIWDQATHTMNKLRSTIDTLNYYKQQLGSIDAYLAKFQDVSYYRSSPCFNGSGGCTPEEWKEINENRRLASESQKRANDALFRALDQQQDALQADARTLERLQDRAQDAEGQMQALGYANQLASQQTNQLLQIRGLLVAQNNAVATKMQAQVDREAIEQAASEQLRRGEYRASPERNW